MPITVLQPNTLTFPQRSHVSRAKGKKGDIELTSEQKTQLRLRLVSLLQTSLEIEKVLQTFFTEAQKNLAFSSMKYANARINGDISYGRTTKHSCEYQLETNQNLLGSITFTRSHRFQEDELELLESLLSCLVCPLQNAFMYRAAIESALKDPLTGTGNRLALENTLEREVNLSLRHKTPLSLVVVDIDNFKHVNDNYGHTAGDEVLKQVAKQLNTCYRDSDAAYRAYRYGGEEFVIILNNTDNEGSTVVGERIRKSVEALKIIIEDSTLKITVSVGAASLLTDDSMSRLFQRADKALYKAKHQGRNRMVCAKTLKLEPEDMLIK